MIPVNPFDPRARPDPYPIYLYMRTVEPVHKSPVGFWILTRYEECKAVLEDERWIHDANLILEPERGPADPVDPMVRLLRASIAFSDPPRHAVHRRRLETAMKTAMTGIGPRIAAAADGLIDLLREKEAGVDLVGGYATPLPLYVIAELLGLPPADRGQLHRWGREIAGGLDPSVRSGGVLVAGSAAMALTEYMQDQIDAARKGERDGLIGALVTRDTKLSTWELIADLIAILVIGVEASSALIGNAMLALLRSPDDLQKLRGNPSLLDTGLEELIRFDGPIHLTARVAKEDVKIGSVTVAAGEQVLVLLGAADRDPARFTEPDRLDLERKDNPHLGFGAGAHGCFAAPLARLIGRTAIATLLDRVDNLELAGEPEWSKSVTLRSLARLPVKPIR
jgi:cytochrome P450